MLNGFTVSKIVFSFFKWEWTGWNERAPNAGRKTRLPDINYRKSRKQFCSLVSIIFYQSKKENPYSYFFCKQKKEEMEDKIINIAII